MPSLAITTRKTKSGPRYVVRYRLGGRAYPLLHGGSFKTLRDAKTRLALVAGELAAGRNPAEAIGALTEQAIRRVFTVRQWADRFLESRLDVDDNTVKNYRSALKRVSERFGDRDPATLGASDVAEWVAGLATKFKPGTVQLYLIAFRLLLDYAGVDPNPARDPRVKLPKRVREEVAPPPADHTLAILEALGDKWRLLFVTIEQGGLRLGEAVGLRWGDVDVAGLRLRLPRSATKRDRPLGLPARMAHGRDRRDLPARGSCSRAARLPRHHRAVRLPGDDACLSARAGASLPPARPSPSAYHDLAPAGCPRSRAGGARRSRTAVDEPGRLQPRHARRRGPIGTIRGPDRALGRSARGLVSTRNIEAKMAACS